MEEIEIIGTALKVLFYSSKNNYIVLLVGNDTCEDIVVTGHFGEVQLNKEYIFSGNWTFHKKYGEQFSAISCIEAQEYERQVDSLATYDYIAEESSNEIN